MGDNDGIESDDAALDQELQEVLRGFSNQDYRDKFWPARRYEDQCDRIALRACLPPKGTRIIEVGAGFGRLAGEYGGYREVILLDPSPVMVDQARTQVGDDPRVTVLQGHASEVPFPDASIDAVVCIRVIHHVSDPRPAIDEFARILRPGGVLVLEYANKRNLRKIAAYILRRQDESPFEPGSERYPDNGDPSSERWGSALAFYHAPSDIRAGLRSAGFSIEGSRSIRLLSRPWITGRVPIRLLMRLERVLQPGLGSLKPAPSIVVKAVREPATDYAGNNGIHEVGI